MSVSTKVATVICTILILVAIAALVYGTIKTSCSIGVKVFQMGIATLLFVLLGMAVAHLPRQVAVGDDGIKVQMLCRDIQIPASEIDSVRQYPEGLAASRLCGTGHFYGHLGLFSSNICGKYYSLATKRRNISLIYRKNKRPIAVSVENSEIFERYTAKHD